MRDVKNHSKNVSCRMVDMFAFSLVTFRGSCFSQQGLCRTTVTPELIAPSERRVDTTPANPSAKLWLIKLEMHPPPVSRGTRNDNISPRRYLPASRRWGCAERRTCSRQTDIHHSWAMNADWFIRPASGGLYRWIWLLHIMRYPETRAAVSSLPKIRNPLLWLVTREAYPPPKFFFYQLGTWM